MSTSCTFPVNPGIPKLVGTLLLHVYRCEACLSGAHLGRGDARSQTVPNGSSFLLLRIATTSKQRTPVGPHLLAGNGDTITPIFPYTTRLPGVVKKFVRRRGSRRSVMILDQYMSGDRDCQLGDYEGLCPLPPLSSSYRQKISPSLSWVYRCHPSRREQATNKPIGYTPNNDLAVAGMVAYGTIGLVLSLRVMKSKAWWALCLPMGSFSEAPSPTVP